MFMAGEYATSGVRLVAPTTLPDSSGTLAPLHSAGATDAELCPVRTKEWLSGRRPDRGSEHPRDRGALLGERDCDGRAVGARSGPPPSALRAAVDRLRWPQLLEPPQGATCPRPADPVLQAAFEHRRSW